MHILCVEASRWLTDDWQPLEQAPDKTGGWKHYFRSIPINRAYKTDRKDGLALAVVVEFTQLCPVSVECIMLSFLAVY